MLNGAAHGHAIGHIAYVTLSQHGPAEAHGEFSGRLFGRLARSLFGAPLES